MTQKFDQGDKVWYHGAIGTIDSVESSSSYVVSFEETSILAFDSDLVKAEDGDSK